MAKVKIELDLDVVQEAIKSQAAPAVEMVLAAHYDIKAMIADQLLREPTKKEKELAGYSPYRMLMFGGESAPLGGRAMMERLVRDAVKQAADEYVKVVIDQQRDAIYAAFRKMMRDSPDRIVTAFVEMIEGADLSLDLETTLKAKDRNND